MFVSIIFGENLNLFEIDDIGLELLILTKGKSTECQKWQWAGHIAFQDDKRKEEL